MRASSSATIAPPAQQDCRALRGEEPRACLSEAAACASNDDDFYCDIGY
jgi:hypothetical protein